MNGQKNEKKRISRNLFSFWGNFKERQILPLRVLLELFEMFLVFVFLMIVVRQGIFDKRYIPTGSMLPNLQIGDQLIVEKVTLNLKRFLCLGKNKDSWQRGEIVVFYPPYQADGQKLKKDFIHTFARLTGFSPDAKIGNFSPFSFMPKTKDAYIKRIIALPGERVEIVAGEGVFINGKELLEPYLLQPAFYNLKTYSDIYRNALSCGCQMNSELKKNESIIVPQGSYFVLGDNRNNSRDSHCWGFVKEERILGRAVVTVWRNLNLLKPFFRD